MKILKIKMPNKKNYLKKINKNYYFLFKNILNNNKIK